MSHGDFRSVLGGQAESEFFQSYGREIESQLMNSVAKIRQRLMQDTAQIQGQGANWIGFVPLQTLVLRIPNRTKELYAWTSSNYLSHPF